MTNQEALELIEENLSTHQDIYTGWCDVIEFFETARESIKKQIPKKPKVYASHPEDVVTCPECGSTFVSRNGVNMNYCNNCGQKIDWGGA